MEPLFVCPRPASLTAIPAQTCGEIFGQIQRIAFQRKQSTPSFIAGTGAGGIGAQATWTALMAASNDTKVVISPFLPNLVIPSGEILKEGGNDNTTISGIPRLVGRGVVSITAQLQNVEAAIRTAIRKLASESGFSGFTNLWMYMFNEANQIISKSDYGGIDVYNVMAGDVGSEGFNRHNLSNFSFDLAPGWSDDVIINNPATTFKPLNL